ncbi:MAG TPA: flagellar export protein FliJ [Spirochaetota bacterium]|nr:flagellar export protein FliJ [Spirochaetota bacterium]
MKKFQFRLQTLLDIRISKEHAIKAELAMLIAKQNEEIAMQEDYRKKVKEHYNKLSKKMRDGTFSYNEALMCERFAYNAQKAIDLSKKRVEQMQPEIDRVRQKLIQASKERKVVERLKEKKYEEYMYQFNREMGKELDDLNQRIYNAM